MTPVLRGSGVLCYVETRVLTRVEATGIDGFMSFETVSIPPSPKEKQSQVDLFGLTAKRTNHARVKGPLPLARVKGE